MALVADVLRERYDVAPTHDAAEMRRLASRFPDEIRLYVVREGTSLLAGTIVYETPTVAHTQYIATSPRGRTLCANGGSTR